MRAQAIENLIIMMINEEDPVILRNLKTMGNILLDRGDNTNKSASVIRALINSNVKLKETKDV